MCVGTDTGDRATIVAYGEMSRRLRDAEIITRNFKLDDVLHPHGAWGALVRAVRDRLAHQTETAGTTSVLTLRDRRLGDTFDSKTMHLIANRPAGFVSAARTVGSRFDGPCQAEIELSRLHEDVSALAESLRGHSRWAI